MEEKQTQESKYIQQHLANERTYLAWIRTSIAMIGIGFLAANLHFNNATRINYSADALAVLISYFSLFAGFLTITFSTIHYFRKRSDINEQRFRSSSVLILLSSTVGAIIFALFILYFMFI